MTAKEDYSALSDDELIIQAQHVRGHSQLIDELVARLDKIIDEKSLVEDQLRQQIDSRIALDNLVCPVCKAHVALEENVLQIKHAAKG